MPVAKLYTGRCTQGKTVLMQRGEQNKWRTEFASKKKKKKNTYTTKSKNPQTKRNPKITAPPCNPPPRLPTQGVMQFPYQIQVQVAKNLTIICCRKAENNFKSMKVFLWIHMRIMRVGDWAVYLCLERMASEVLYFSILQLRAYDKLLIATVCVSVYTLSELRVIII